MNICNKDEICHKDDDKDENFHGMCKWTLVGGSLATLAVTFWFFAPEVWEVVRTYGCYFVIL